MTEDRVIIRIEDGIAEVTLNRPEKLNAFDAPMFEAVAAAGARLMEEPGLRAVVLTGAGRAFCAGIDTAMLMEFAADLDTLRQEIVTPPRGQAANRFQQPCTVWADLPVPVIAALHGVTFGAGMQLALGADLRIAAKDTQLSIMETRWGLIPDMGLTKLLPGVMRADQALDMILSARVIEGPEAQELGLVTRVAEDPLAAARDTARAIAARSPEAVRGAKELVRAAWPGDDQHLALEARLQAAIIGSANQMEAVMAGMQKRAPKFS
ncbi:crotonase/enoyl-CoA hydratase family protein [Pararhodobacter marinus]|uniref:Crotonase/enoyl-CoA hydratase family protein n=1 Tax=Pararhodobacter marinus TaxID=2184063 RepID=A0A2U2C9Q7_9RHOB|nr:crotonase/enoyl-CoA hydratase family protein [Pararhodobacter marinus]PWE28607.1 crotonase/enoyl-CoA hydratase family protein [Pararhodobacter marinus]